jgi:hypothetical protein
MTKTVTATRYAAPLREGGSLPALVEADDDGLYVVKLRGAGQGPKALVAELIAAGVALELGLPVPEAALVEMPERLPDAEPDPEIQELLAASVGVNAGLDFLPGALPYTPAGDFSPDPELAADIVWFDAFLENVDRSARNVNMLLWHGRLWLIDHGAALYRQHAGLAGLDAAAPFKGIADHVLLPCAGSIESADERLAGRLSSEAIDRIVAEVPADWLGEATRSDYTVFLIDRLAERSRWVDAAEAARTRSQEAVGA